LPSPKAELILRRLNNPESQNPMAGKGREHEDVERENWPNNEIEKAQKEIT